MRRVLSSFLAILVLVLSCFPCSDVDAATISHQQEASVNGVPDKNWSGHATDLCSPFCSCSCCAGFAIPAQQNMELKRCPFFSETALASYLPEATLEVARPIWQPPKLV